VVVASSFSTNTTVTIAVNTDYTIANAAISANYYSYQANPQGYPHWFVYTPTYTGFSANPGQTCKYSITGNDLTLSLVTGTNGTSNATTFTITLPVASVTAGESYGVGTNAGGTVSAVGSLTYGGGTVLTMYVAPLTAWTNSGGKGANNIITYQI
jgi:hypothetical protein